MSIIGQKKSINWARPILGSVTCMTSAVRSAVNKPLLIVSSLLLIKSLPYKFLLSILEAKIKEESF